MLPVAVCLCQPLRKLPSATHGSFFPCVPLSPFIALQTPAGTAHLCCYGCNMLEGFGRMIIASISLLPALWFPVPRPQILADPRTSPSPARRKAARRGFKTHSIRQRCLRAGRPCGGRRGRAGSPDPAASPRAPPRGAGGARLGRGAADPERGEQLSPARTPPPPGPSPAAAAAGAARSRPGGAGRRAGRCGAVLSPPLRPAELSAPSPGRRRGMREMKVAGRGGQGGESRSGEKGGRRGGMGGSKSPVLGGKERAARGRGRRAGAGAAPGRDGARSPGTEERRLGGKRRALPTPFSPRCRRPEAAGGEGGEGGAAAGHGAPQRGAASRGAALRTGTERCSSCTAPGAAPGRAALRCGRCHRSAPREASPGAGARRFVGLLGEKPPAAGTAPSHELCWQRGGGSSTPSPRLGSLCPVLAVGPSVPCS